MGLFAYLSFDFFQLFGVNPLAAMSIIIIIICIIRVGWGSLALGNLCFPLVLFTFFSGAHTGICALLDNPEMSPGVSVWRVISFIKRRSRRGRSIHEEGAFQAEGGFQPEGGAAEGGFSSVELRVVGSGSEQRGMAVFMNKAVFNQRVGFQRGTSAMERAVKPRAFFNERAVFLLV